MKGRRLTQTILLFYLVLTFCFTVLLRPERGNYQYELTPFWSYSAIEKRPYGGLFYAVVLNILFFVPIGVLVFLLKKRFKLWECIIPGILISCTIEISQFFLKRGLCETDDVIHNTLGYIIGYCLCALFWYFKTDGRKVCD